MANEETIGTFTLERETKNTYVFYRTTEGGRREAQYVPKSFFNGQPAPQTIQVVVRW